MQDEMGAAHAARPQIDNRILRHLMHEALDLLDCSASHADEACTNTDAAMALTRIDWMLMAVFNWLTGQLRNGGAPGTEKLGEPVSVRGIDQSALSRELRGYAQAVDRLHARVGQLENLIETATPTARVATPPNAKGKVLRIFGDPAPGSNQHNPVLESQQRLKTAFTRF